jgi:hypothetical protein
VSVETIKQYLQRHLQDTGILEEYLYYLRNTNQQEGTRAATDLLKNSDEAIRAEAMWFIEMLGPMDSSIVPDLLAATKDSNLYVRSHAIVYLMEKGLASLIRELIAVLEDEKLDSQTRSRAALILGRQNNLEAINALTKSLDDKDPSLIWNVIHAVEHSEQSAGNKIIIDKLRKIAQQSDSRSTPGGLSLSEKAYDAMKSLP